ncbi:MAG: DMT family transporter [Rhizobiaceae bacterium]
MPHPGFRKFDKRFTAMMLMTLGAFGLSFGGLIVRNLTGIDAATINFHRSAALIVSTLAIISVWHRGTILRQLLGIGIRGLLAGAILGCAGITFLMALIHTTVANTVLITSSTPLLSAVLAFLLLGERLSKPTIVAVAIAFAGVTIMVLDGLGTAFSFGNLMALVTATGYAIFAVALRSGREIDMLPTVVVAGFVVAGFSFIQSGGSVQISTQDWLLCVLWGGILSAGAHLFLIIASKQLAAAELSLFMLLEVALAPLWVWWLANEAPVQATLIGGGFVIAGLLISLQREMRTASLPLRN